MWRGFGIWRGRCIESSTVDMLNERVDYSDAHGDRATMELAELVGDENMPC